MNKEINDALKINSKNWMELRKLFEFITQIIPIVEEPESIEDNDRNEAIKELYNLFVDQEIDFYKQVKKYSQDQKKKSQDNISIKDFIFSNLSKVKQLFTFDTDSDISNIISNVDIKVKQKTDNQFIQDLHNNALENIDDITKNHIISRFLDVYQEWRNDNFHSKMKKCIPKYSDRSREINSRLEHESEKNLKQIEVREFTRICKELEKKYSSG